MGRDTEDTEQFGPEGNVLVWLDHPPFGLGPVGVGGRGVIVIMHDANQAATARSFIVSYPFEAGGDGRQLGAVSDLLAARGWSLLASNRRKTEFGHADTAILDNTSQFGEQRLGCRSRLRRRRTPAVRPCKTRPGV